MDAQETVQAVAKCHMPMASGRECGRPVCDDERLCICHSEKPGKNVVAFQREFSFMLDRKDYDFRGFVFPDGIADFAGATFDGEAIFTHTIFQGYASFHRAKFQDKADFTGASFRGEANFFDATFQGKASFVGIDKNRVFSTCPQAVVDFRHITWDQPEKITFTHVFLVHARFLDTEVRKVDFTDVEWARRPPWRPIRWLSDKLPEGLRVRGHFAVWDELTTKDSKEHGGKDYALIAKLYRQLRHNYEEQRNPITAGDFHIGEMEMRRLSDPPKNWFLRWLKRNLSFLAPYKWLSGYGESYLRPLLWIVGVICLFMAAFKWLPAWLPAFALQVPATSGGPQAATGLGPHLLYSIMCFLLRGDRPLEPMHMAGHYLSVAEGVIGPPLIAMFVLALNRRFKR